MAISILTVSQLNRHIKNYLENEIGTIHVEGEISNLSKPSSGHYYFTLKDKGAQLRCVFFKSRHQGEISAKLTDGQHVVASGKLSLYEARGDYQLIVEQLTHAGLGTLYQRFEALKNKLATQGLFDPSRKKSLPKIPQSIGIISSPSGAALQDILSTLARRFPQAEVVIYPSEVQGGGAPAQLIKAIRYANVEQCCDVLILARGGGSIEDLWAFNDEQLALQIAASHIPIVSGVGHETDFTIADFVADYRAETPTAAATVVTPDIRDLSNAVQQAIFSLITAIMRRSHLAQVKLDHLTDKISSPQRAISSHWQKIDHLERHLISCMMRLVIQKQHQLHLNTNHLNLHNPLTKMAQQSQHLQALRSNLISQIKNKIKLSLYQLNNHLSTLHAVSPLATLDRGYAIASHQQQILLSTKQVTMGAIIDVRLAQGSLLCSVNQIKG